MNLHVKYMTKNDCYKANEYMKPKGIMVHSTGANNPNCSRYVDQRNGWNRPNYDICPHAVIGWYGGEITTVQTLPFTVKGWHAGGAANRDHIGFEICEDNLQDRTYFNKVYAEAVSFCAYLCKKYGISPDKIICHSEGYKKAIATNHADVMHWFPIHGKNMDMFRKDVKNSLLADHAMFKRYRSVSEMPLWAQKEIQPLIDSGIVSGVTIENLDLSMDMIRTLVMCKRMLDMK